LDDAVNGLKTKLEEYVKHKKQNKIKPSEESKFIATFKLDKGLVRDWGKEQFASLK